MHLTSYTYAWLEKERKTAWYINKIYIGHYTFNLRYIIIDLKLFVV